MVPKNTFTSASPEPISAPTQLIVSSLFVIETKVKKNTGLVRCCLLNKFFHVLQLPVQFVQQLVV
jgi:hypothetical protein